jgi:endonuclease/exonuclease/phosphatase family metal-dependent hydrolase
VRVATWNVEHAVRRRDGVVDVELAGRMVASLQADVVALQELDVRARRSARVDQPAAIATVASMRVEFAAARRLGLIGRYGVALSSRSLIDDVDVVRLPGADERRVALVARTRGVSVAVTHLSRVRDDSARQLDVVLDHLLARPGPHLLLGDLNRREYEVGRLAERGLTVAGGAPTYPSDAPRLRIDHVAVSHDLAITRTGVPSVDVSDHRPLVVDIEGRR